MKLNVLALKPKATQEEIYRSLIENNNTIFSINKRGKITNISSTIEQLAGYADKEVIGQRFARFVYPQDIHRVQESMTQALNGNRITIEFRIICKNKDIRYARATALAYIDGGRVNGVIGIITDISEHKKAIEQLKRYALYDSLTGLYNRKYFQEEISRSGHFRTAGIIVCDVDGLKVVNDTFGYDKGDAMIITTAEIIKNCFTASDIIARIGGSEFAAIFYDVPKKDIEAACGKLKDTIEDYNALHEDIPLSLSVGYAIGRTSNLEELFSIAGNNMYREKLHRSKSSRSTVVKTLMKTLKEKDFITEGHADRLQDLVVSLARTISLPENMIPDLKLLAQFHDIGKVAVSDSVLLKPASLTKKEIDEMRRHSEIGYRIAMASPDLAPIAKWILRHHEWWDGSGYPLGLKGEEIPLECRVLTICDAYDAMTSNRPYRKARSKEIAIEELRRFSGRQFDPELVEKFIEMIIRKNSENPRNVHPESINPLT